MNTLKSFVGFSLATLITTITFCAGLGVNLADIILPTANNQASTTLENK